MFQSTILHLGYCASKHNLLLYVCGTQPTNQKKEKNKMNFVQWTQKVDNIRTRYINRTITPQDATFELSKLDWTPPRIAKLLRQWENTHTIAAYFRLKAKDREQRP